MAKRTIQTCRFYADIPQYLKALGYYDGSDAPDMWDMNPVNVKEYDDDIFSFQINKLSIELDQLLTNTPQSESSGLYLGVFAHTLATKNFTLVIGASTPINLAQNTKSIINGNTGSAFTLEAEADGYTFVDIRTNEGGSNCNNLQFTLFQPAKIGAVSFGRWFEPSHSPDLQVKLITEFDGITNQSTVGGNTITNINHLGQPHWGDLPAWTLKDKNEHDYKLVANTQRRTWQVKFSYMADDDVFNKANNPNKFFTVTDGNYVFDTSMASFFGLTLNGNLRFWFCPNSAGSNTLDENQSQIEEGEKDLEFALCQIDQDSLTFNQVAHRTFDVSMNIREVW